MTSPTCTRGRRRTKRADWYHKKQLADLWEQLEDMGRTSVSRQEVLPLFRQYWEATQDIRTPPEAAEPDALTKSTWHLLKRKVGRTPTLAEVRHVAPFVRQALGPQGGQDYAWSRERESRMRLCKALDASQLAVWQMTDRVPDTLTLDRPVPVASAQAQADRSVLVQSALAGLGVSPLAAGVARPRR